MTPNSRYAPLYSIGLILLAIVALVYVVASLSVDSLGELRLRQLAWWVFPAITALHLLFLLLSAEVWRRLVRALTATRTRFMQAYLQVAVITVGKYVPGKIWGFVARAGQMHREQVPLQKSIESGVVEQILVLAGSAIVSTGAAIVAFPESAVLVAILGATVLAAAIVATVNVPGLTRWIMRKRGQDVSDTGGQDYHWIGLLRFSVGYAFLWLISGVILAIIYFALFDVVVSAEKIAALILANTVGFVAGFFALFAPGGIGVREAVTTAALTPFLPMHEALLAAVAFRAWLVLFDAANAVLLIVTESRRKC
ncbi:MAG: lysylphosphatidylglycerol synthase domain-containing protein [Woeseiaceae bacterium]